MSDRPETGQGEARRWRKADGSRLVLTPRGHLLECVGAAGDYRRVRTCCPRTDAARYAAAHGYEPAAASALAYGERGPGRPLRVPPAPAPVKSHRPRGGRKYEGHPELTAAQQAEVDARIAAHAARVAAELSRLGPRHSTCKGCRAAS